jgi:hypothetical protein
VNFTQWFNTLKIETNSQIGFCHRLFYSNFVPNLKSSPKGTLLFMVFYITKNIPVIFGKTELMFLGYSKSLTSCKNLGENRISRETHTGYFSHPDRPPVSDSTLSCQTPSTRLPCSSMATTRRCSPVLKACQLARLAAS